MANLSIQGLGRRVMVVAPHPDDESIGCGGLIALLRREGIRVDVVVATDGAGSHPNSAAFPPLRLAALRRAEVMEALEILGIGRNATTFLNLPDRFVPEERAPGFAATVGQARDLLNELAPATLVIPSEHDEHGDHRSLNAVWQHAARASRNPPKIIDYIVWGDETAAARLTLDITDVLSLKRQAIAAHRSQHGQVVTDDETGFTLPPALLAKAERPYEVYFEGSR